MTFKVKTEGLDRLASLPERKAEATRAALRESLWTIGGRILARARELAPLDTGALRASGFVGRVEVSGPEGAQRSVTVGFHVPYAEIQEEREDYEHRVGQAHYLRDAIHETAGERLPIIKAALGRLKGA